ncbi:MAG: hypothetical protein M3396_04955 [Actinomycetota bacterium]|nr:hypothetical protein [Actinomycetota bacterium]MDQ3575303.1 hypothetical protein [Actinomycetota bacterium]
MLLPSRRLFLFVAAGALTLGTACRDDTVRLSYQPPPGNSYSYRVEVEANAVAKVGDEAPRRTQITNVFDAQQSVLDAGPSGTRVQVRLSEVGGLPRSFVVRLDRAAQLVEVQSIEGLPSSALGGLGLSEIFPAAAGAPPDRPLAPGSRWVIDEPVQLASPETSRLNGQGRLAKLGVMDGREVATVVSNYRLPVKRTAQERRSTLELSGSQDTNASTTYDLLDGSVVAVEARTHGTYALMLLPPEGTPGTPIPGTLTVEVRSTTRLVD